jgi:oxalate decarboxylase/phosphoglucose isomerase-like protein (cupin superfamily)
MSRGPSEPSLPHRHIPQIREISKTMEFIFVRKGNATVNLSDERGKLVRIIKLGLGDMVLLVSGWHSLTFEEGTEIIEVKQGPYSPNSDKIRT